MVQPQHTREAQSQIFLFVAEALRTMNEKI